MKKIALIALTVIYSLTAPAMLHSSTTVNKVNEYITIFPPEQIIITNITMQEGTNTISVKGNKGTITLLKKADLFSNVIFTDNAGITYRLMPKPCKQVQCAFPVPEACFGADQVAVINICRVSNAAVSRSFTITLFLASK